MRLSATRTRRAVSPRGVILLLILLWGAVGGALWAQGRGYKTWVLGRILPHSRYALHKPTVVAVRPADRDGGVTPDAFIACDVNLPNSGKVIDASTLAGGVQLLRGNAREKVPAIINTTGGGDAIVLRPLEPLALNALYTFEVLPALRDTAGASFEPFSTTFSTAAGTTYTDFPAAAEKVALPTAGNEMFTGLTVGPDRRLYATTIDGRLLSFPIQPDGTLGPAAVNPVVVNANNAPRLLTGIVFDPASTPTDPIAWVTHSYFPFDVEGNTGPRDTRDGYHPGISSSAGVNVKPKGKKVIPEWTGKLSRLSGPGLTQYQDIVVGLPRARHDHTTNQLTFGPDGCVYLTQASNTAMGAPDHEWGYRPERLLSAAILRVDTRLLPATPLDVRTDDAGSYDPFAPGAPLTIYASGVRNAYDLVWHSNGNLYAPLNGSARGGNSPPTPAGSASGASPARRLDQNLRGPYAGPAVPGLSTLPTQNDYLLRIEPGGYYGHPNPARAEFVLNGGHPAASPSPGEVPEYPVGVLPDRNYRLPAYDFGKNLAPCGILEYHGRAFPALRGKLLIARYSGGKDVYALSLDPHGAVTGFIANLEGFTHFIDPVDLTEDPATGFLYVSEFTGRRLTLLRPAADGVSHKAVVGATVPHGAAR